MHLFGILVKIPAYTNPKTSLTSLKIKENLLAQRTSVTHRTEEAIIKNVTLMNN